MRDHDFIFWIQSFIYIGRNFNQTSINSTPGMSCYKRQPRHYQPFRCTNHRPGQRDRRILTDTTHFTLKKTGSARIKTEKLLLVMMAARSFQSHEKQASHSSVFSLPFYPTLTTFFQKNHKNPSNTDSRHSSNCGQLDASDHLDVEVSLLTKEK